MTNGNLQFEPVEVAENIFFVGFSDEEAGFSNNPYLIVDGNEAALIDPGPAHPLMFEIIETKVKKVLGDLHKIRYLIASHQDPDIAGNIPLFEKVVHPDAAIFTPTRTSVFIPYYNARNKIIPVEDGDKLRFESGRELKFIALPYLHFAGNMATLDLKTKTLFSSDIFAGFTKEWNLYADENYINNAAGFISHYIGSKDALEHGIKKLSKEDIELICPQHGLIIRKELIGKFISAIKDVKIGTMIEEAGQEPDEETLKKLIDNIRNKVSYIIGKDNQAKFDKVYKFTGNYDTDIINIVNTYERSVGKIARIYAVLELNRQCSELKLRNPLYRNRHTYSWKEVCEFNIDEASILMLKKKFGKKQFFDQYSGDILSEDTVETDTREDFLVRKRYGTVMFTDIRGFTAYSESVSPRETISMLNKYIEFQHSVISKHEGTINKILGDGILAIFWGDNCEDNAINAAIEIIDFLVKNKNDHSLGIGINSGNMILGDVGTYQRLDYTIIGDTVNTSSRLCDLAKSNQIIYHGNNIKKMKKLKETHKVGRGQVVLKGKKEAVTVFLISAKENID